MCHFCFWNVIFSLTIHIRVDNDDKSSAVLYVSKDSEVVYITPDSGILLVMQPEEIRIYHKVLTDEWLVL